jgi:hypothetical protein
VQRRTAGVLGPLEQEGYLVLHDITLPGWPVNIDCDDPERGGRGAV